ncbi:TDT family transporter [Lacticaseibacillus absianus]|uniref:TDT family transporter n=1 Tax=Lacticaseibacillus absianus TaxID=2729623 RepID=UPI0015C88BCD|nr:TDT family transporter [Lacticaseibacillus absianus]
MKTFLTRLPLPVCGLMLGLASLGRLNASLAMPAGDWLCSGLALLLWVMILLKLVLAPRSFVAGLADPVITSVMPNLTMATMLLAVCGQTYGLPHPIALALWLTAVVGHYAIMGVFLVRHLWLAPKHLAMVMPSWFVAFVGIGVIPLTCGPFAPQVGLPTTWLALGLYAGVFPLVLWRMLRVPLPVAAQPLTTIIAAPASLCLAAYLTVATPPNAQLATGLFWFCQLLYLVALVWVLPYFTHAFVPSMGAFTFPLAITATAITKYTALFGAHSAILHALQWSEWAVICVVDAAVAVRYARFIGQTWPRPVTQPD